MFSESSISNRHENYNHSEAKKPRRVRRPQKAKSGYRFLPKKYDPEGRTLRVMKVSINPQRSHNAPRGAPRWDRRGCSCRSGCTSGYHSSGRRAPDPPSVRRGRTWPCSQSSACNIPRSIPVRCAVGSYRFSVSDQSKSGRPQSFRLGDARNLLNSAAYLLRAMRLYL